MGRWDKVIILDALHPDVENVVLFPNDCITVLGKGNNKIVFFPFRDVWKVASREDICPDVISSDVFLCVEKTSISCSAIFCAGIYFRRQKWWCAHTIRNFLPTYIFSSTKMMMCPCNEISSTHHIFAHIFFLLIAIKKYRHSPKFL